MREIKFRAWHKALNVMLNVYVMSQQKHAGEEYISGCRGWYGDNQQVTFAFDEVEWLEFIGLHDKNGKEIYEGDILQWNEELEVKTGIMEWHNGDARFRMKTMSKLKVRPEMLEVVGNICENKCDTCRGTGSYEVYHDDSEIVKGEATCSECEGAGFIIDSTTHL